MLLWGLGQPAAHGQNAFVRHGACSLAPDACATADPGGGQGGGGRCAGAGRRIPQAPQGRRCTGRTRRDASPIFFACRATAHRSEQEMGRRRTSTLLRPDPVFTPAPASHSGAEGQDDAGGGREVPGAVVWESSVLLARFLERAVLREGLLARGSVGRCFAQPLVVGPPRRAQPLRSPPRWQQQLAPYRLKCDKEPLNNKFELGTACDQCKPKSECDIDSMSYVYIGCYCSVKATPPLETMSKEHAMRFPLVGSAMLLSLFLLFKFLSKDLVNTVLTAYFFILGIAALCATLLPSVKRFLPGGWNDNEIIWRAPFFHSLSVEFTKSQVVASIPGFFFCVWYAMKKHWLANNVLGIAFCIQGIEMLSLGSFKTGGILLAGLFVYDIFWVFFTPVMVSVAKSFDAPIKLLFPTADAARPFSMLGLGDIVIPGIFVALALRFDVSRGIKNRYFNSAFLGYTVGLTVTIIVMNWFQAAQPALLYIVPGVTGFVAVHSLWNGEVKPLLEFNESKAEEEEAGEEEEEDTNQNKKVD